jgi:signal transduction histidine kinase
MSQLIETLLWINRSSDMPPESKLVDLGSLVKDLIEKDRYLLMGKQVEIIEKIEPVRLNVPTTPAKIILGNLIRNAFQYTSDGEVFISVKDKTFIIRNSDEDSASIGSVENDYGYGIGLDLVKHITKKLEWDYIITPIPGGREVLLRFKTAQDVAGSNL